MRVVKICTVQDKLINEPYCYTFPLPPPPSPHPSIPPPSPLKMLLPKRKLHIPRTHPLRRLPNLSRRRIRPTEIHAHLGPDRRIQPANIPAPEDPIPHRGKQPPEIRSSEVRPAAQLRQRIDRRAHAVELDVLDRVHVQALREVRVDAQEVGAAAARVGRGLRFEAGEQCLEPFEGGGVLADPDELDAAQARGRVRPAAEVPDVFEDGRPRRDADTGADQDGNLVVEDVFGGGAVGAVDAQAGHLLPVLEGDLVHAHGVEGVVVFGLGGPGTEGIAEGAREVADLTDVDADVGVEGAGGDGEGVPLRGGDGGHVEHDPLAGFVFHGWLGELDLHGVVGVADDFDDLGRAPRVDFAVEALEQVDATAPELPPPALVADAVVPEVGAGEGGVGVGAVADEAVGGVGVEAKQEGDEEVVRVPERLERLLPDFGVRGGVHQKHAEEHDVPCDAAGLSVVDPDGSVRSDLGPFDIEEAGRCEHETSACWLMTYLT